jgi:lysophospholipase L1-like esterase
MSTLRKLAQRLVLLVVTLLLCEGLLQAGYRVVCHRWLFTTEPADPYGMFLPHPYLAITPEPNAERHFNHITISHNAAGWRGRDLLQPKTRKRIVVVGGSSTYCVGVDDTETYPAQLQRRLGDGYEVINLGVPAYSSVEHIIQTALWFSDIQPDIAIYYMGWNDAHNMHVRDLKADYSDFHGPLVQTIPRPRRGWWPQHFALARLPHIAVSELRHAFHKLPSYRVNYPGLRFGPTDTAWTPQWEERPLSLYRRNADEIAQLCKAQGVTPLFVPQLYNTAALTNAVDPYWPFVNMKDCPALIDAYNRVLSDVGRADGVTVATEVAPSVFVPQDFLDQVHLSAAGCRKMAEILEKQVRTIQTSWTPSPAR